MKLNKIYKEVFKRKIEKWIRLLVCLSIFISCVEPYEGTISGFEDTLVVSAIITNELKSQEVILTRSYRFEDEGPLPETDAFVVIKTAEGLEYIFEELDPGVYKSINEFSAEIDSEYTLWISTSNGDEYRSTPMNLPVDNTSIDNLFAERIIDDNGQTGMAIYIDSFDPEGASLYYRHDFIETFKIIAPFWSPYDAVFLIEGEQTYTIPVILREQEERVCYGTNMSSTINLKSTAGLVEDRLVKHLVRFIDNNNYILSHRYSILVRQYIQNPETFSYYETLKGLSQNSNNVFSEDQPGFIASNIFSLTNPSENIAGFFEVSTVSEKRIFFNYDDFFPDEELPKYVVSCALQAPSSAGGFGERDLVNLIRAGSVRFYDFNINPQPNEGEYIVVSPPCGDCTTLGSNRVPDFWIE